MRRIASLLLVLVLTSLLIPLVKADEEYTVSGIVYDISNNQPLEGACVQLSRVSETFHLLEVVINENLEVTVNGAVISVEWIVVSNHNVILKFRYGGRNTFLHFVHHRRIRAENGQVIVEIRVVIKVVVGGETYCVVTNENGGWSLTIPEGEYYLVVSKDGYTCYLDYLKVNQDFSVTTYLMQLDSAWMNWVRSQISGIQENIEGIREEILQIWENIALQNYEINSLKQRVASLEERMDKLENRVSQIEENLLLVWKELEATRRLLAETIEGVDQLEDEVQDLQSRVGELEVRISNLEVQVYNIWLKIAEIEKKITVPEGIPRFTISGRVSKVCENYSEPYGGLYVWIGSYNLVPMDTYTDSSGSFRFENVVGDRVVLRVKDLRYEWILTRDANINVFYSLSENRTYVVSTVYGKIYLGENIYENQVEVSLIGVNRVYSDNFVGGYCFQNVEVGEYVLIARAGDLTFTKQLVVTHEPLEQDIALQKAVAGMWWVMPLIGAVLLTTFVGALVVGARAVRRR